MVDSIFFIVFEIETSFELIASTLFLTSSMEISVASMVTVAEMPRCDMLTAKVSSVLADSLRH